MKNMIKNVFFHFGAPILVAAFLLMGIGVMLIIGIPEIQSYIKCSINEMNQE